MKEHALAVHLLLDASGSMRDHIDSTRKAANEYIAGLATALVPVDVSVSQFRGMATPILSNRPSYDIPEITAERYKAAGGTCLYPSVKQALDMMDVVNAKHKALIILTDGEDGMKEPATLKAVKKFRDAGHLVIFIGCTRNALCEAQRLGLPKENALVYDESRVSTVMSVVSQATFRFFSEGQGAAAFTDEERAEAEGRFAGHVTNPWAPNYVDPQEEYYQARLAAGHCA